jgi:hypothetical protein
MTVTEVYISDDGQTVHIIDRRGQGEIPVRELARLYHGSCRSLTQTASYNGRRFDRYDLADAVTLADNWPRCTNCKDAPGTEDMGEGKKFCASCCSAAQGSRYDDAQEEW